VYRCHPSTGRLRMAVLRTQRAVTVKARLIVASFENGAPAGPKGLT
jgi:hypothetical protein